MRFLVVDDSAFSRRKIADFISHVGGTVIGEASDGLEAVEQYSKLLPEFVTMDIEMPKINGIEASKEILKINKDAKIILITSSVDKKEHGRSTRDFLGGAIRIPRKRNKKRRYYHQS